MIDFKYPTFFLIILITLVSCTKDKAPEVEMDTSGYYVDYIPDIVLSAGDSISIDVVNNSMVDVAFYLSSSGAMYLSSVNSEFKVSDGKIIGFSGSNLDTIAYTERIDDSQAWTNAVDLFIDKINYVGLMRQFGGATTYGWVKIKISGGTLTIDDHYFRNVEGTVVRAGIKTY